MPQDACDMTLLLIAKKMAGNFGLAPKKWREQLEEIRALPVSESTGPRNRTQ